MKLSVDLINPYEIEIGSNIIKKLNTYILACDFTK